MSPSVSVIIPSLDGYRGGNVQKLVAALKNQTVSGCELVIVIGERPCARAHNVGVQRAHGDIIVFFDDDIAMGHNRIIKNLIAPLLKDQVIGITGASQLAPPEANRFQKRCARQLGRMQYPIISEITESDMATHAAMAIRKDVFIQVGQENENLIYGDDPDLRARVRKAGYKIVVVPDTWVFHPPPKTWRHLLSQSFQRGQGSAHDFLYYPQHVYETPAGEAKDFTAHRHFMYRWSRAVIQMGYSLGELRAVFLFSRIMYILGYAVVLIRQAFRYVR